jgi:hypothetical protein
MSDLLQRPLRPFRVQPSPNDRGHILLSFSASDWIEEAESLTFTDAIALIQELSLALEQVFETAFCRVEVVKRG